MLECSNSNEHANSVAPEYLSVVDAMSLRKPLIHGTEHGYKKHGCRCMTCKQAHAVVRRAWYLRHRERLIKYNRDRYKKFPEAWRNNFYKKTYGITLTNYNDMLVAQNNACAICLKLPPPHRKFAVDHNHKTGTVRGILCPICNRNLGWWENYNKSIFAYLEKNADINKIMA